jgi:polyferredoxin
MKLSPRTYRKSVQWGFFAFILYLGFRLWQFAKFYDTGATGLKVPHPDGVEGFLPIGALTSLKYWLVTGHVHPAHPAAMFILIGAIATSAVFKKSFCGWICPVGLISDWLRRPWRRLFKRELRLPAWLDYPLRSLKYIIFLFFFFAIVTGMGLPALHAFLDGDYWKVADVKMLVFFTDISALALDVIVLLAILSLFFKSFWCRYLCPYGALLGLLSLLSPFNVRRDKAKCIDCGKCARECPASLPVDKRERVLSPECTSCQGCVSVCPVDALAYNARRRNLSLTGPKLAAGILMLFLSIYLIALTTGNWRSQVSQDDLKRLVPIAASLEHP